MKKTREVPTETILSDHGEPITDHAAGPRPDRQI
jgi:hypothetical protein